MLSIILRALDYLHLSRLVSSRHCVLIKTLHIKVLSHVSTATSLSLPLLGYSLLPLLRPMLVSAWRLTPSLLNSPHFPPSLSSILLHDILFLPFRKRHSTTIRLCVPHFFSAICILFHRPPSPRPSLFFSSVVCGRWARAVLSISVWYVDSLLHSIHQDSENIQYKSSFRSIPLLPLLLKTQLLGNS